MHVPVLVSFVVHEDIMFWMKRDCLKLCLHTKNMASIYIYKQSKHILIHFGALH